MQHKWMYVLFIILIIGLFYIPTSKQTIEPLNGVIDTPTLIDKSSLVVKRNDYSTLVNIHRGNTNDVLLLIHGTPLDQTIWQPIISYLQNKKDTGKKVPSVVTYDLRGFGSASDMHIDMSYINVDTSSIAWNWDDYVEDLRTVHLEVAGNSKVHVAGWGFGGMIAQKDTLTDNFVV